jgi:hypothetical protein
MHLIETFNGKFSQDGLKWNIQSIWRTHSKMTRKRTSENDMVVSGGTGSAPARRNAGNRTRTKHTAASGEMSGAVSAETLSVTAAVTAYEPSRDEIAQLAYLFWESRGGQGGSSEADWLRAEQELRGRSAASATA